MARVPTRTSFDVIPGGGSLPFVRGVQAPQNVIADQVNNFGSQLVRTSGVGAQHIEQGQAEKNKAAEEAQNKLNRARVQEGVLKFREDIAAAELEYSNYSGSELVNGEKPVMPELSQKLEKRRLEIAESLHSEDAKYAFDAASKELFSSYGIRANAYEAKQAERYIEQQRDGVIVANIENSINQPEKRAESFRSAKEMIEEKYQDQGYTGKRLEQVTKDHFGKLIAGNVDSLIESGDADALNSYLKDAENYLTQTAYRSLSQEAKQAANKQKYEAMGLGVLEGDVSRADVNNSGLPDNYKKALLSQVEVKERRAEAEREAKEAEYQASNFAMMRVAINDGHKTRADVDLAFEEGLISPSQYQQLAIQAGGKKQDFAASETFLGQLKNNVPVNPYDTQTKKGADELWKRRGGNELLQQDPTKAGMLINSFVQAGIMPAGAVSAINGFRVNGSSDQKKTALQVINDIYETNDAVALAAFKDSDVEEARDFVEKVRAGVSPDLAMQFVETEREARKGRHTNPDKMLIKEARQITVKTEIAEARGNIGARFFGSDVKISGGRVAELQMLSDYSEAFEAEYVLNGGDEKRAERVAQDALKRTWGKTDVGSTRVMPYPPEMFYKASSKVLNEMLLKDVSKARGAIAAKSWRTKSVELVSDAETMRLVMSNQAPTYTVQVTRKDGVIEFIPGRYQFDFEEVTKEAEKEAVDPLAAAISKRNQQADEQKTKDYNYRGISPNAIR